MRSWGELSPKSCPAQFWAGSGGSPDFTWASSLVISIDVACCGSRSPRAVPFFRKRRCVVLNAWLRAYLSERSGAASKPETGPWSRDAG